MFANAVYIIIPEPTVLTDGRKNIHTAGRVRGSERCLPIRKVIPIAFIIRSSIFFTCRCFFSLFDKSFQTGIVQSPLEISVGSLLHSISELLQMLSTTSPMDAGCPASCEGLGLHLVEFTF